MISVGVYFKRFDWALELSKIPESEFPKYALVHIGAELNKALKILVTPRPPEELTYVQIKTTLTKHFDHETNKYAESIRFRQIVQEKDESLANFPLRLKKGAVNCEYGNFLDRMLIEQLLHGLESRETCNEIIAKKPNAFTEAYNIAHALEATHKTAIEMKTTDSIPAPESTNKLGYATPIRKRNAAKRVNTGPFG